MNNVGRSVADALEANEIRYDAIEKDHERFVAASADGYPVAFGDLNDVRLMETLAYAERNAIIITIINHDEAEVLKQVLHERYPNLTCFITVETETDRKYFESMGLRAVINRSVPCGLDLAAAVLRHLDVNESAIQAWMQRQQERALQDTTNTLAVVVK
jgi:CPA2 family monovalent cation:H+ antiporter-2